MSEKIKKRAIILVLDSLGIGALPDADSFGDAGANTLESIVRAMSHIDIPNLREIGIGNIEGLSHLNISVMQPQGAYGRMAESSKGKDTTTGHWEIAGLLTEKPFKTFEKFPKEFIDRFEKAIGTGIIGNYQASGTEIIDKLGSEHERTGKPIVYTSADSVFQIAANTDVIPLEKLYDICEIARKMLVNDLEIGRVIARPYVFKNGTRTRTSDRKDYSLAPPSDTLLDNLKNNGFDVIAIGKITDIFAGRGITKSIYTKDNDDGVEQTVKAMRSDYNGLIFTNLVDFDSKYGHRRDAEGYGRALESFDKKLPQITESLSTGDILFICADHGNDPEYIGWDHTREFVPVLIVGNQVKKGVDLGTLTSFADLGTTVAEYLGIKKTELGRSFLNEIIR